MLRRSGVLKYHPTGLIAGLEYPTIMSIAEALGYDRQALLFLLEYAEAGLREAVKNHGGSNQEHFNPHRGN
jgi:hypothetical protein